MSRKESLEYQTRLHRRIVSAYKQGTSYRWEACILASWVVGKYAKGQTLAIASDLAVSVSQVLNLARAGETYRALRKYGDCPVQLHALRERLTPTHFSAAGELWHKYEIDPADMIEMLQLTADSGGSVISLREGIEGTYGHNGFMEWEKRIPAISKQVTKLVSDYGVPEQIREAGMKLLNVMAKKYYGGEK